MTIIVPHNKKRAEAIAIIDRGANSLFEKAAGNSVAIAAFEKDWEGSTMNFSFTGSVGFISIPLEGTLEVDDVNVVVECDLPPMVRQFIGDEKIAGSIEPKLKKLLKQEQLR